MKILPLVVCLLWCAGAYGQGVYPASGNVVIGKVDIEGNTRTKRHVILRELNIHEGCVIRPDSINAIMTQNKLRLFNLQLFNEVEQEVTTVNADTINWHIHVKERWYIIPTAIVQFADRNVNTWWVDQNHEIERVSGGFTVTDKNFRGNLEALAITVQAGYTQRLGLSYMRPYVNKDLTKGIGIVASVAQSRQAYYTTALDKLQFAGAYNGPVVWRQADAGVCYISRPGYARRHIVQATYRQYSVGDTIVKLNPGYYNDSSKRASLVELSYRYEYNGVDNWNYSLKGEKLVAVAVARAGIEGIKFQNYVNVEAGIFRNPLPHWYVSAIARGRVMYPMNQPYYFRNGLGTQTDYVRGYEYYVTDGYSYGLVRLGIKREVFNNTYSLPIRYFTAMPVRVYPKVFFDAGYIDGAMTGTNTLPNQMLYSVGAGLDIVTFYDVKIRIEYARNHLGQNGVYLHFNSE